MFEVHSVESKSLSSVRGMSTKNAWCEQTEVYSTLFPVWFNADSHIFKLRLTSAQTSTHSSLPHRHHPIQITDHMSRHTEVTGGRGVDLNLALWQLVAHPEQKIPTLPDFYYPFISSSVFKRTNTQTKQQARWSCWYMNESPSQLQCSPGETIV